MFLKFYPYSAGILEDTCIYSLLKTTELYYTIIFTLKEKIVQFIDKDLFGQEQLTYKFIIDI